MATHRAAKHRRESLERRGRTPTDGAPGIFSLREFRAKEAAFLSTTSPSPPRHYLYFILFIWFLTDQHPRILRSLPPEYDSLGAPRERLSIIRAARGPLRAG